MDWTCPRCYRPYLTLDAVAECMAWHASGLTIIKSVYGYGVVEDTRPRLLVVPSA